MKQLARKIWMILLLFGANQFSIVAQVEEALNEVEIVEVSMWEQLMATEQGRLLLIIGGMLVFLIILLIVMAGLLVKTAEIILRKKAAEKGEVRLSFYQQFKKKWVTGNLRPVDQQADMLLDHNYDGIKEMDYGMPPWLKYVFIGTFLFAVFYVPAYLIFDIVPDQQTEYQAEIDEAALIAEAKMKAGFISITAETAEYQTDEAVMKAGQVLYKKNCAVCHADDGGGGVGPNLTDDYWIHGEDMKGVFTTISEGVPAKGMIPWKGLMSPQQIQDVSNYILSMVGTAPAQGKEPQGELRKRREAEERIEEAAENPDMSGNSPIEEIIEQQN